MRLFKLLLILSAHSSATQRISDFSDKNMQMLETALTRVHICYSEQLVL